MTVRTNLGFQVELTPGELDANAELAFTRGQCHSLALALHEATDWPLRGVGFGFEDDIPHHCGVEAPSGRIIDVHGSFTPADWAREWGLPDVFPINPDDARHAFPDEYGKRTYYKPDVEAARPFVDPVLRRARYHKVADGLAEAT